MLIKFVLKNRMDETISSITAYDLTEAINIFAEKKKLSIHQLLEIFIVEEAI